MKILLYRLTAVALLVFFPILALTDCFEGQSFVPAPGSAFLFDPDDPENATLIPDNQNPAHFLRPSAAEGLFSCCSFVLPDERILCLHPAVIPPFAMRAPPMPPLV